MVNDYFIVLLSELASKTNLGYELNHSGGHDCVEKSMCGQWVYI
jgi:hypothetical protein